MISNQFDLWIPASADAGIAPRSAVVSSCDQPGDTRLSYFEGNIFGASNLLSYSDRVRCAVGRAIHRYPNLAKSRLPVSMLQHVGTFDARSQRITAITDPAAVSAYLAPELLPHGRGGASPCCGGLSPLHADPTAWARVASPAYMDRRGSTRGGRNGI